MAHNPSLAEQGFFALRGHQVLALEGRDAGAFAQAQFMNDVAGLAAGHWQWNGWLTPKGRVIALFALLKFDEQTLWLLLPDAGSAETARRMQGFLFRSKVSLDVAGAWQVSGATQSSAWASGAHFTGDAQAGVELDMSGGGGGRSLRIGPPATAQFDDAFDQAWTAADLCHGLPRLPASQVELWTPQQLSLARLQAYSVKKGCYPGQEIVARTHFLGQAKRGLALLESDGDVAVGSEVRDAERVLGTVVSSARAGPVLQLLAVLSLQREGMLRLGEAGIAARERALDPGLAR